MSATKQRCPENKKQKQPKLAHDVVSDRHACSICKKPIKQRLVNQKKTTPKLCYRHWLIAKGLSQKRE